MNLSEKVICLKHRKGYKEECGDWVYREKDIKEFTKWVMDWAEKWGYKGVSPDCMKELKERVGEKLI